MTERPSRPAVALFGDPVTLVTGSPWQRRRRVSALRRSGYVPRTAWLQVEQPAGTCLVPLLPGISRWYLDALTTLPGWRRKALAGVLATRAGRAAVAGLAPTTLVLLAPRPGSTPYAWLEEAAADGVGQLVILARPGGSAGAEMWHVFREQGEEPIAFAYLQHESGQRRKAGDDVSSSARSAGVSVPERLGTLDVSGWHVQLDSHVRGVLASALLARDPRRVADVLGAIGRWLLTWGVATRSFARPAPAVAEAPAEAPLLAARVQDLRSRVGAETTVVAAHGDLATWNVVVDGANLAVVDWEAATAEALPLGDLFYAAVDVVLAAGGYRTRADAVRACFHADGERVGMVASLARPLVEALRLPPPEVELSFLNCWLSHAQEERRRCVHQGFAGALEWLEANHGSLARWLRA